MATRLPIVGGDSGNWGQILNDYLSVELNTDGTLKKANDITTALNTANAAYVKPSTGIPATDLTSTAQTSLTKADTSVQIGGDIGGTSIAPTVTSTHLTTPLPLTQGGTAAADAAGARASLGLGTAAVMTPATIAADAALSGTYGRRIHANGIPGIRGIPDIGMVMSSGQPTVSESASGPNAGIVGPTTLLYTSNAAKFRLIGTTLTPHPSVADVWVAGNVTPNDSTNLTIYAAMLGWAIEFYTDSPLFEMLFRQVQGNYRIYVDDYLVSANSSVQPNGGSIGRINVDFSSVGGRVMRKIRVEGSGMQFKGLTIGAIDTVWATAKTRPLIAFIGDSYTEGTGTLNNSNVTRYTNFAWRCAQILGCECLSSGSGATGYLKTSTVKVKYRDRWVNDVARLTPDVVVVTGGRNDVDTDANVGAEALLLFQDIRTRLPSAPLIVVEPWAVSTAENALANRGAAIAAAAAQVANTFVVNPLSPGLITGTGYSGSTTGNGNADVMVNTDHVHPTQLGHDLLGQWLAQSIANALPLL